MTPELLMAPVLAIAAAALVGFAFQARRRLDDFDPRANTDSPAITPEQRANRKRLRSAMEQGGFRNYPLEWWHYTFVPEPTPDTLYDVPVR